MIAMISLSMPNSIQSPIYDAKSDEDTSAEQDIAVVPLAMPMVAGPGAIVTVVVNTPASRH
jgi:small neutral amino acid transporter SnatA (MarC family)